LAKKLFIKTYGCQMNVYDSERMTEVLAPLGYEPTSSAEDADMVVLNTCHIREKASEKVFSELGRLKRLKTDEDGKDSGLILAVAGCVAQAEGAEILARAPYVDLVVGPQAYHRLPELVASADPGARRSPKRGAGLVDTDFPAVSKFDSLPEQRNPNGASAFLSVQEGCDKFCTFCVVPYTRGAEYSRPAQDVIREARNLVSAGVREITLLGQNVNAYHGAGLDGGADWGLGRLIRALAEIDGLARIRYTTSHPRDMEDDLIAAHGEVEQLMPFLHLPVQSGSDRILQAMNRKHGAGQYRRVVERLREARPDLALSSDFIVGYPGESDGEFAETLRLISDIGYAQAYSFAYSPRPGTPAAEREDQIDPAVSSDRLQSLQQLLNAQQLAFNQSVVGSSQEVLVERKGSKPGQLVGRGPFNQAVHFEAPERLIGQLATVQIIAGRANSLSGEVVIGEAHSGAPQELEGVAV
jgi:tRNA-2-methylthio-N6-dimethylallyladenosine synthase